MKIILFHMNFKNLRTGCLNVIFIYLFPFYCNAELVEKKYIGMNVSSLIEGDSQEKYGFNYMEYEGVNHLILTMNENNQVLFFFLKEMNKKFIVFDQMSVNLKSGCTVGLCSTTYLESLPVKKFESLRQFVISDGNEAKSMYYVANGWIADPFLLKFSKLNSTKIRCESEYDY